MIQSMPFRCVVACVVILGLVLAIGPAPPRRGNPSRVMGLLSAAASPAPAADTDNPANFPFHANLCDRFGTFPCNVPKSVVVPSTTPSGQTVKRLVVEYVSGACNASPTGSRVLSVDLFTTLGSDHDVHNFFTSVLVPDRNPTGFSQPARLYGDPGKEMFVGLGFFTNGTTDANCSMNITGYLVTQ